MHVTVIVTQPAMQVLIKARSNSKSFLPVLVPEPEKWAWVQAVCPQFLYHLVAGSVGCCACCPKEERNSCKCKISSLIGEKFPGESSQWSEQVCCPFICQLSPFFLNWSLLRRPQKIWFLSLHLPLKVLHPRKRLSILTWKRNSWLGRAYRSSAFQWHFCSKHFKHKNKCKLGSFKSVKPFSRWHYFLRWFDKLWLVVKISVTPPVFREIGKLI